MDVGERNEVFLLFVACHHADEFGPTSGGAEEDLSLAVLDVFLYVKHNLFRESEVFHVFGKRDAEFLAESEEMVDGIGRIEDYRGVCKNVYTLVTEFSGADAFDADKRFECQFQCIACCKVEVG